MACNRRDQKTHLPFQNKKHLGYDKTECAEVNLFNGSEPSKGRVKLVNCHLT